MNKLYGVTWATPDHSIAQTGYEFTHNEAISIAQHGPSNVEHITQIDAMCGHSTHAGPVFGRVECPVDSYEEFKSA